MEEGNNDAGFAAQVIQAISAENLHHEMSHSQHLTNHFTLANLTTGVPLTSAEVEGLVETVDGGEIADLSEVNENSPPMQRKMKRDEGPKNKRCMLCGAPISSRLYCWKCYKRKQRGKDKDIDPHITMKRGRPHKPIAEHSKPAAKFKKLEEQVEKWIGNKDESNKLLEEYVKKRAKEMKESEPEETQIYTKIGIAICELLKELPPTSPFRKPLLHTVVKRDDIKPKDLKKVLPFSNGLYHSSRHLADRENILFILKSLPNSIRERLQKEGVLDDPPSQPQPLPAFAPLMEAIPMVGDMEQIAGPPLPLHHLNYHVHDPQQYQLSYSHPQQVQGQVLSPLPRQSHSNHNQAMSMQASQNLPGISGLPSLQNMQNI